MKTKFLISLSWILCVTISGFSQKDYIKIKLNQTFYKAPKTYFKKDGTPLNGKYAIKINSYQINKETFLDGFKNGEAEIYRNNKLAEKGLYTDGSRNKEWLCYREDGSIYKRTYFKDGLKDSLENVYYNGNIVETNNYYKKLLHGWTNKYYFSVPNTLYENAYYLHDKIIKKITYKSIDSLRFTIVDSSFYNEKNELILLKSFINDTLKLLMEIKYNTIVKDIININTIRVNIYKGNQLNVSYFFPCEYDHKYTAEGRMVRLLIYEFAYYTDTKKPELLFSKPEYSTFEDATFYMQYPDGNLKSVIYSDGDGDILPGWYFRDVD